MALTYQQSGVNYSLMDPFKNACLKAGGYSPNIVEFPDYFLVDINEGLGSLNKLADDVYDKTGRNFYYQVGWGNAASILNDLTANGASPLSLKLFVATGSESWFTNKKRWQKLVQGFRDAADFTGAKWNGGETQTLVGIVDNSSIVLGGSAVGVIKPKTNLLTEDKLEAGDRIILLASSGVHTNGITLIRKIFQDNPQEESVILRKKTTIYSPLINKILEAGVETHYASHITGHGWRKIMRSHRPFSYIIEKIPKPQPVFRKIQDKAGLALEQMYGDYNMGVGFALYAPQKSVGKILELAKKESISALDAGFIKKGPRKVAIKPLELEYQGSSLQIR